MQVIRLNSKGLSSLPVLLGLVILAIVGGTGFYVKRQSTQPKQTAPVQQVTNPQTQPTNVTNPVTVFNIEVFYNQLQTGMTPAEVIKLAGKQPDDCSMTDSEPTSQNCFWYNGNKTVNVSYGNKNVVQAKSKTGF